MTAVTWESRPVCAGPDRQPGPVGARHLQLVPAASPTERPLRVTRLGRLVLSVSGLLLVASFAISVATSSAGAVAPVGPSHSVTVLDGQTLSEIAVAELPGLPVDVAVTRLQLANALSTSQVRAGQMLVVPGS